MYFIYCLILTFVAGQEWAPGYACSGKQEATTNGQNTQDGCLEWCHDEYKASEIEQDEMCCQIKDNGSGAACALHYSGELSLSDQEISAVAF